MLTAQGGKDLKNPAIVGTAPAFIPPPKSSWYNWSRKTKQQKKAVSVSTTVFAAAAEFTSSNGGVPPPPPPSDALWLVLALPFHVRSFSLISSSSAGLKRCRWTKATIRFFALLLSRAEILIVGTCQPDLHFSYSLYRSLCPDFILVCCVISWVKKWE